MEKNAWNDWESKCGSTKLLSCTPVCVCSDEYHSELYFLTPLIISEHYSIRSVGKPASSIHGGDEAKGTPPP